tara:strand:- start:236 stop:496 length:261 start_codon:yes stop_codon:yes gene_type:complete
MKITKQKLRQMIKEEFDNTLQEAAGGFNEVRAFLDLRDQSDDMLANADEMVGFVRQNEKRLRSFVKELSLYLDHGDAILRKAKERR